MKTRAQNLFLLSALIAGLGLMPGGRVTAQTFTTLHNFSANNAGSQPQAGLILSGGNLYGTTLTTSGNSGFGTVFQIAVNGASFTNLHSMSYNSDGGTPYAGLVLSGNTLYGTANRGGTSTYGTVFAVNTDGSGFTNLHSFTAPAGNNNTNNDGYEPYGGLAVSGNTLFGTAYNGGTNGYGTVFRLNTDGTGFTNLHSFFGGTNEGTFPEGGLILSGNTLYGTTQFGGASPNGTIFKVSTDGSSFTNLHNFTALSNFTNSDGANPYGGLILSGNTLYGTAPGGGSFGYGTVFAVNTDGSGFTNLHSFTALSGNNTNTDGIHPYAGLTISGNTLYGTTISGGFFDNGTVFAVNTDGTGFTNLHSFTTRYIHGSVNTNNDGATPYGGLVLSGNTLYGTASAGGTNGFGTVFSLSLGSVVSAPPQLTIIPSGANVILTWPASATGFTLQSATNLSPPVIWSTVSGQFAVTNPISGTQQFYRLSQ